MINHFCNICKKEIPNHNGFFQGEKFTVKVDEYVHGSKGDITEDVHICKACCEETLKNAIQNRFGK